MCFPIIEATDMIRTTLTVIYAVLSQQMTMIGFERLELTLARQARFNLLTSNSLLEGRFQLRLIKFQNSLLEKEFVCL